jgi:hypothetical protein
MEGGELQGGSAVPTVTDEEGRATDAGAPAWPLGLRAKLVKAADGGDVDEARWGHAPTAWGCWGRLQCPMHGCACHVGSSCTHGPDTVHASVHCTDCHDG